MRLTKALKRLLNSTKARLDVRPVQALMPSGNVLPKMLEMIDQTRDVELSCDEVHELLDEFAELVQRSEDVTAIMPLVEYHVEMCPDCREEFEALMRIMAHAEQ